MKVSTAAVLDIRITEPPSPPLSASSRVWQPSTAPIMSRRKLISQSMVPWAPEELALWMKMSQPPKRSAALLSQAS
ncbi:hypothetical protein D3C75_1270650 [compost metagenome]